jgi:hypothetical protein
MATEQQTRESPDHPDKPERSQRVLRREARRKLVREARTPRKVRVSPTKPEFRNLIKHPNGGGFRSSGSVEWPLDSFTKRRIRDGDVVVEKREQNKPQQEVKPERRTASSRSYAPSPSHEGN